MDHSSAGALNGVAGAGVPRVATRKPLSARISQIEAKIQSAGGQVVLLDGRNGTGGDESARATREAQYELIRGCSDVEKLKEMALSVLRELEDARLENTDLTQSLRYVRSQLADTKLRAESAEAQVSELEGKVQNLGVRLEQLLKTPEHASRAAQPLAEIAKPNNLRRMPSTSARTAQLGPFNSQPTETPSHRYATALHPDLASHTASPTSLATKSNLQNGGNISPKRTSATLSKSPSGTLSPALNDLASPSNRSSTGSTSAHTSGTESDATASTNTSLSVDPPSSSDTDAPSSKPDASLDKDAKPKDKRSKKPKDRPTKDAKNPTPQRAYNSASPRSLLHATEDGDLCTESGDSPVPRRVKGTPEDENTNYTIPEPTTETEKRRSNPFKRSSKNSPTIGEEIASMDAATSESTSVASGSVDSAAKDASAPESTSKPRKDRSSSTSSQGKTKTSGTENSGALASDALVGASGPNLSSASLASTASAGDANGDRITRRTSASSISSASGDYSSFGSTSNLSLGKSKKKSEKSLGKHYDRAASPATAGSKSQKPKISSEDMQTDVETSKSAQSRNYRRGGSGDLESTGVALSIVDPSTLGSGKRRNSPSNSVSSGSAPGSPIQVMSGNHKGRTHSHTASTGHPVATRTFARHGVDAASATDHEGEYHTEMSEAKFRALERKRSRQHSKDAIVNSKFGVAFGVRRGACESPCPCECYVKKPDTYACEACTHFPAQHADLGKLSDDEDELLSTSASVTDPQVTPKKKRPSTSQLLDSRSDSSKSLDGMDASGGQSNARRPSTSSLSNSSTLVSTTNGFDEAPVIDAHWLLNFSDCYFINQLGKGNSSTVFLGEYQTQQVAIKVLRQETHKRDLEDFKKEMEIMCSLRSPYIVHFFGATLAPKLCIVLEYCSRGTLFHYLHDDLNYVDWGMALRWLVESARGINTLHLWKPQIVHRDLKTLNLLLDEKMQVKVCDFGLSRYVSGEHDQSTFFKMRGTFAYFAPEVYQGKPFTSKSDVYSFGIILWEIVHRIIFGTHTRPFAEFKHINHDFQIIIQAAKGLRPTLPFSTPRLLVKLYEDCVAADPDARPTCAEIIDRIEAIQAFYEQHLDTWDALVKGGVRIRPHAATLRKESQASPSRGSRAELLRTPVGSRNLSNDLTRRGVTATLLREKSLSSSTGGYGTDSTTSLGSEGRGSRASLNIGHVSPIPPNIGKFTKMLSERDLDLANSQPLSLEGYKNRKEGHARLTASETLPALEESSSDSVGLSAPVPATIHEMPTQHTTETGMEKSPSFASSQSTVSQPPTSRSTSQDVSQDTETPKDASAKEGPNNDEILSTTPTPASAPANALTASTMNANTLSSSTATVSSPPSPTPDKRKTGSTPGSSSASPKRGNSPNNKRKKKMFDAPNAGSSNDTPSSDERHRTPSPTPVSVASLTPSSTPSATPTATPTKKKRTTKHTHSDSENEA